MTWVAILLLAAAAFGAAAWWRLPRALWSLTGAALCLGLSGYALQGAPELPGKPTSAQATRAPGLGAGLIELRRAMFGAPVPPSRYVVVADGFARRGDHAEAAAFLRNAVLDQPRDTEAWVALGLALESYADGRATPASRYAWARARALAPQSPAPPYFEALGFLREGSFVEARDSLAEAVALTPEDAPYRRDFEWQLSRLDLLLDRMEAIRARSRARPGASPGAADASGSPPIATSAGGAWPAAELRRNRQAAIGAAFPDCGKHGVLVGFARRVPEKAGVA